MEHIAIISDIHGNIPALEGVLADIDKRGITRVFCLGDLIGKGPDGDQAVDLVNNRCEVVVQGNWDQFITEPGQCGTGGWHRQQLGGERLDYLRNLPFCHEFYFSGNYVRLLHASPFGVHTRIRQFDELKTRLGMFEGTEFTSDRTADIVGYGDLHHAFSQHFGGGKTLFNVGSVGNPLDFPLACYCVLQGYYGKQQTDSFSIEFVRVKYDVEKAIELARESQMPGFDPYQVELRTAVYQRKK